MTEIEPNPSPGYLVELGGRLLRAKSVTNANMLCRNLGRGDLASAIETIVTTDIELTDTSRYSAWRKKKFGFEPAKRINPSQALFTPEKATKADRALIEDMVGEDTPLYEKISAMLNSGDGLSIRGAALG
jgi:hypothetical protein